MFDAGKVIIGLLIFIILISFPIWYNVAGGKATYVPELEKASRGSDCVRPTQWMRYNHMDLLDDWRDQVVREGDRYEEGSNGSVYEKSLTHTCLDCHQNKNQFCDKCHDYLSVDPYCWDCHINPKEMNYGGR
jgi:hypothetical protein